MKAKIKSFFYHLLIFVIIELLLVALIFHELPTISFFTWLGLGHVIYFIFLPLFGWWRIKEKNLIGKIGATTLPLVLHVIVHLVPFVDEMDHHYGHEHNMVWVIIMLIIAFTVIMCGEYLLHKKNYRRV